MSAKQTIKICEYDELAAGVNIGREQFDLLENFILSNVGKKCEPVELMGLSVKKGKGKVITAKNYVGTITLSDGTNIEILPKIYGKNCDETSAKRVLTDMLRTLRSAPVKSVQTANINTDKLPLFEVFIRMFTDEVYLIVKHGLKSGYVAISSDENVLKGKLDVKRQLRENCVHKERFCVTYDEFNADQPENRLLKSTLLYLNGRTQSVKNKQDIKTLLAVFCDVPRSLNYAADFEKIVNCRNNAVYRSALSWSKVFLTGQTFTAFSGKEYARALLFPMDVLFESYITAKLRRMLPQGYGISVQDRGYYLFDAPCKMFSLRPDIVINSGNKSFIMDTKWKILSAEAPNLSVSQGDMYQMYAYFKEYEAHGRNPQSVTLIYPFVSEDLRGKEFCNGNVQVKARFADLTDINASLTALTGEILHTDIS